MSQVKACLLSIWLEGGPRPFVRMSSRGHAFSFHGCAQSLAAGQEGLRWKGKAPEELLAAT